MLKIKPGHLPGCLLSVNRMKLFYILNYLFGNECLTIFGFVLYSLCKGIFYISHVILTKLWYSVFFGQGQIYSATAKTKIYSKVQNKDYIVMRTSCTKNVILALQYLCLK